MAVTSAMVIIGMRRKEKAATATKTPEKPGVTFKVCMTVKTAKGMNEAAQANRRREPRIRKRSASHPKIKGAMIPATGREQVTALRRIPEIPCATSHGEMNGRNTPIDAYETR